MAIAVVLPDVGWQKEGALASKHFFEKMDKAGHRW